MIMAGGQRRKKPKDFEEFWPKYVGEINQIKREIKKLKIKKLIQIFGPIIVLIALIVASLISLGWIPPKNSPDTVAYETIQRITNTTEEGYKITIENRGLGYASNIKVDITFPFQNTTIYKIYNFAEELITYQVGGVGSYQYTVEFSKIRKNEEISLILLIENEDFEKGGNKIIKPDTRIWTDEEGEIRITTLDGPDFIH